MKRKHIMLAFQYQENWIGGTYYMLSIIKALNLIADADKPQLTILHSPQSSIADIQRIGYPHIGFFSFDFKSPFVFKVFNRLFSIFNLRYKLKIKLPFDRIDNFYPFTNPFTDILNRSNITTSYAWIPDFQERHLPQYFSSNDRKIRNLYIERVIESKIPVVFSSATALKDFDTFYPENRNPKFVLPFVSVIDKKYKELDINVLLQKYGIQQPYFIVTNQFWKHKNHLTVIKAFEILAASESSVQLVLTGKEHDDRNPTYPEDLKRYVAEKKLKKRILFLGFIDRADQLKLMSESLAIIQPSLFEGWSTVVEDAKALERFIIVSGIDVHKEQIKENCLFFKPEDFHELAEKMKSVLKEPPKFVQKDYQRSIEKFAHGFLSLFK